jgi:WXG100 family type VII secretion target
MPTIKVTSEDLHQTSASLRSAAEQIKATSEQAMGQVNALVSAGWTGNASAAFDQAFTQWNSGAKQVDEALTRISQLLDQAAQSYESTEASIQSSFG